MITSIKIENNENTPFDYIPDLESFKNGKEYVFNPGVNIVIGGNGSGKSTLINLIARYMFCEKTMCSSLPSEALSYPDIFDGDKVFDGISIKADYVCKVFRLLSHLEMDKESILKNMENFESYLTGCSSSFGEKTMYAINSLFENMFRQKDYRFPVIKLKDVKESFNSYWKSRIDSLIRYYAKNHVNINEDEFEFTVLMDEPDRNLDIDNIIEIYNILSFHKPQTQIITVIHNPVLIYKLSKLDSVNFVQMEDGYLNRVIGFVK